MRSLNVRSMRNIYVLQYCFILLTAANGAVFKQCKCKVSLRTLSADCSELGLTNISDVINCLPNTTKKLNLSNNSLQGLPPKMLKKLPYLVVLNLSYNKIEYLEKDTFTGMSNLQYLSLGYNKLKHNNSYADGVLKPLQNLIRLDIQGNCDISITQCLYPDKVLSYVTTLEYLHIDGILPFGLGFSRLRNLRSLFISSENGYCSCPVLAENIFEPLRKTPISYLHLDGCDIRRVEPNVFRGLRNLTTLTITDNRRLCSDSIDNATLGLNETNIHSLRFNDWCIHRTENIRLKAGMLKGLTNTSLKTLDLGSNDINYVDSDCIKNLPISIRYLSLKDNEINRGEFLKTLRRLANLEILDISYQNHHSLKPSLLKHVLYALLKINTTLKPYVQRLKDDELVHLPRKLKKIYMNNIKLEAPVPPLKFGPNQLQYLDASGCLFTAFLGPWYGLTDIRYLDLSSNKFSAFSRNSLVHMKNLKTLYLQNNQIGNTLQSDSEGQTFSSQRKLEELDLSNNFIRDLSYNIFKNQESLRRLLLSQNSMKNISFSLKSIKKLEYLDLSENEIDYISDENMDFLDHVAATGSIYVNLTGNILSCLCDSQKFINWLDSTKVKIVDLNQLQCLYRNKTLVSLSRIHTILYQLKYGCTSWIVMMSCVVGFVGLLLVFSLLALLYHRRWELRYLWYIGRINIDPYHHPDDERNPLLEIAAYISYEQHYDVTSDVTLHKFVTNNILPFFERRYTLKIREEFEGNDKLYNVIPKTVRKSRKVIVLLTPSYCKDYWNVLEFNIAAYEGIYTKRNIVVPVLVGDIFEKHLTPEIRSFIRSKIRSKEVLRFPSSIENKILINAFNEQLEKHILA